MTHQLLGFDATEFELADFLRFVFLFCREEPDRVVDFERTFEHSDVGDGAAISVED